MKRWNFKN